MLLPSLRLQLLLQFIGHTLIWEKAVRKYGDNTIQHMMMALPTKVQVKYLPIIEIQDLPGGASGKESACQCR